MKLLGILAFGAVMIVVFGYMTIFGGSVQTEIVPATNNEASQGNASEPNTLPENQERESFAGAGTIQALYERGDSLECQITYIPNPLESEITGNIFTDEGRVRGDFVVPAPDLNGQTVASLIYDTVTLYVWSEIEGETFGVKQTQAEFVGFGETSAGIDYGTEIQYSCLTWPAVDSTIFEPPVNVLFNDMVDIEANMEFGTIYEEEGEF